ncbi:MAG TPA: slipin family protein [Steroidobacteraceae bacterium]|jgi:regulator of protease activity HflC (stomatin/prohibitin superfamily)|nr:slipin family protein [Steroidobacteraceae bacterium]
MSTREHPLPYGQNSPATVIAVVLALGAVLFALIGVGSKWPPAWIVAVLLALAAALVPLSLLMARQWEKAVVLRFGKLHAIRGPGLFMIVPFVDTVTAWIDQRIQTTEFNAEQALTRDTVPTNIDAILFWQVHDPERAALEIADYRQAILRVAQTSLREMIGSSPLSALLSERKAADQQLKEEIGRKTSEWGVSAVSVEIRDVAIPAQLQDAMSRQAQAEREKAARVILGSAEEEIAQKFLHAATTYGHNPVALQLRAMNIIYETTKERGATVLIPSSMVDSMNVAGVLGLTGAAVAETAPAA